MLCYLVTWYLLGRIYAMYILVKPWEPNPALGES